MALYNLLSLHSFHITPDQCFPAPNSSLSEICLFLPHAPLRQLLFWYLCYLEWGTVPFTTAALEAPSFHAVHETHIPAAELRVPVIHNEHSWDIFTRLIYVHSDQHQPSIALCHKLGSSARRELVIVLDWRYACAPDCAPALNSLWTILASFSWTREHVVWGYLQQCAACWNPHSCPHFVCQTAVCHNRLAEFISVKCTTDVHCKWCHGEVTGLKDFLQCSFSHLFHIFSGIVFLFSFLWGGD